MNLQYGEEGLKQQQGGGGFDPFDDFDPFDIFNQFFGGEAGGGGGGGHKGHFKGQTYTVHFENNGGQEFHFQQGFDDEDPFDFLFGGGGGGGGGESFFGGGPSNPIMDSIYIYVYITFFFNFNQIILFFLFYTSLY